MAKGRQLRFLANVDPVDVARALNGLNPETTLVVVVSKTFTTAETMLNARTVRWASITTEAAAWYAWFRVKACRYICRPHAFSDEGFSAAQRESFGSGPRRGYHHHYCNRFICTQDMADLSTWPRLCGQAHGGSEHQLEACGGVWH